MVLNEIYIKLIDFYEKYGFLWIFLKFFFKNFDNLQFEISIPGLIIILSKFIFWIWSNLIIFFLSFNLIFWALEKFQSHKNSWRLILTLRQTEQTETCLVQDLNFRYKDRIQGRKSRFNISFCIIINYLWQVQRQNHTDSQIQQSFDQSSSTVFDQSSLDFGMSPPQTFCCISGSPV